MKRHFVKKYIFTILFLMILFSYAGANMLTELPVISDELPADSLTFTNMAGKIANMESIIDENIYRKYTFIELYGFVQNILGKNEENNFTVVRAKDGGLNSGNFYNNSLYLDEDLRAIKRIHEIAQRNEAQMLVLLAPDKYIEGKTEFADGIPFADFNAILDEVKEEMINSDIFCIDTRDYLTGADSTAGPYFYKTDHHWTSRTAFLIFQVLVEQMEKKYGIILDEDRAYCNLDNYNVFHYSGCFLGSFGRKAGVNYSGLDDFDLIYPKFETKFKHTYRATPESDFITMEGAALDSLLDIYNLNNTDSIYSNDKYSVYLDSVNEQDYITNQLNKDGPRILVIRDSFMSPVATYLANVCSQLDMVWSMSYNGDLEQLAADNRYDYIIVETGSTNFNDEALFKCVKTK